jgi:hypothetical protein
LKQEFKGGNRVLSRKTDNTEEILGSPGQHLRQLSGQGKPDPFGAGALWIWKRLSWNLTCHRLIILRFVTLAHQLRRNFFYANGENGLASINFHCQYGQNGLNPGIGCSAFGG